jgi:hypothetical protein
MSIGGDGDEDSQMIDDKTVDHLLAHIASDVIDEMRKGRTLEEIDEYDLGGLRKNDRIALYECMVGLAFGGKEGDALAAHLRALKRLKRLPQPNPLPAGVIPLRP